MTPRSRLATAWLALLLAGSAAAQTPSVADREDERPIVTFGTSLIQVDAIVTNKDGRPVTDLARDDFEVFQDGKREDVSAFVYLSTPEFAGPAPDVPPPPARAPAEPVRRTIAIVVDDLKSVDSARVTREAVRRFVDERMEPGDLVAIVQARAGAGALQQFSADRQILHAAADRIRYVPRARLASDCDETGGGGRDLDEALRTDVFVRGTLGVLNFVVRGLKGLPGRKSVVLLSDGMPCTLSESDPGGSGNGRVRTAVLGLVDLANRSAVSVYSVDVRGVVAPGAQSDAALAPGQQSVDIADRAVALRNRLYHSQDVMSFLAEQTGGLFLHNNNDIATALRRAADDQRGYYLLAYEADPSTFDPKTGGREFHKLSVRVKRPGLEVRSRSGFYGYTEESPRPETRSPARQMVDAVISPFAATDVRMQLTPLFADDPRSGPVLRCLLHVDARDLTFADERDGSKRAVVDVVVVAFGDNGGMVSQQANTHEVRIAKDDYALALERGLTQTVTFPMKRPGAYQLRAAVRDAASSRIGSDYRFVELPDVAGGNFALSSVVVSSDDVPVDLRTQSRQTASAMPVSPAVRAFRRGDRLTYGYEIYNAGRDRATKRPSLLSSIRLYHEGRLVHTFPQTPLDPGPQSDWSRIRVGRGLQLGAELEPGSYVFEVVVADATGKGKTASQWADFDVVGSDEK